MRQIGALVRSFDYTHIPESLLTNDIVNLLAAVQEFKGRQLHYLNIKADVLDSLARVARVQSIEASNGIEGIRTSNKRLQKIVHDTTDLRTRDEEEIAGYRDVLATIHDNYEYIDITPNVILQLHKQMYRYSASSIGGHFKIGDNVICGIDLEGKPYVRFKTVPAVATVDTMQRACDAYRDALRHDCTNPLIASLLFIFDFTCIHPFNDGNGRMSRLLTLLLMYKSGYMVGKYISIEKEIEHSKAAYYKALETSSVGWHENSNDPAPFVKYMLEIILATYRDFDSRVTAAAAPKTPKPARIEAFLQDSAGKVVKHDIQNACPDISKTTIERTLADLLAKQKIKKIGAGPKTGYAWIG